MNPVSTIGLTLFSVGVLLFVFIKAWQRQSERQLAYWRATLQPQTWAFLDGDEEEPVMIAGVGDDPEEGIVIKYIDAACDEVRYQEVPRARLYPIE